jgi:hypothetical protein
MDLELKLSWKEIKGIQSTSYKCGYCNNLVASEKGWTTDAIKKETSRGYHSALICICHKCNRPTYFDPEGEQIPGVGYGNPVSEIPEKEIQDLYEEARRTIQANAYTATVLCCRKLLMHIAVSKDAKTGEGFKYYVDYLSEKNFVPPDAKGWINKIREIGNVANHKIKIMKKEDAEELLKFMEMLLKIIYEFPALADKRNSSTKQESK